MDHDALFEGACAQPSRIREYFSVKLGARRNKIRERGGEREKVRLQCIGYQLCDVSCSEEFIGAATVNPLPVNFTHILEKSTFVLDPYGRTRDTDPENKRVRTNPSPSISSEPRLRHEEQQVSGPDLQGDCLLLALSGLCSRPKLRRSLQGTPTTSPLWSHPPIDGQPPFLYAQYRVH